MKEKHGVNLAAQQLAKKRWADKSAQERSAHASEIASLPRVTKRCFCGAQSMWTAALRNFDCCRKAGVVTLNLERKREIHDGRRKDAPAD